MWKTKENSKVYDMDNQVAFGDVFSELTLVSSDVLVYVVISGSKQ